MGIQPQDAASAVGPAAGYAQAPAGPQYPPPATQYQQQQAFPPQGYPEQQAQPYPYAQGPPATATTGEFPKQPAVVVPQAAYGNGIRPQPIPGMAVRGPRGSPAPGSALIGYEVCQPETGCCKFDGLSSTGLIAIILLLFIFWPVAFIPCLMPECYEAYQRPVYGPQ